MKQSISIRDFKEGDEKGIFELHRAVYPESKDEQNEWLRRWHWQYRDNPAGGARIWLAEDERKIVAQYAILPVKIKINSDLIIGAQSLYTMTHPQYRRQGIFEILAKETYRQAGNEGIHLIYGFPNEFSYPGFKKKLSWFDVATLQHFIKPINWKNVIKIKINNVLLQKTMAKGAELLINSMFNRMKNPPIVKGLVLNQVDSFDNRFDEFWIRVSNQYNILVVRNKEYLNWRYSTPGVIYTIFSAEISGEVHGYLVMNYKIRNSTKLCNIFDAMACSTEILHNLVSRAIEVCRQQNVDLIRYSLIANKAHHQVLRDNGFILFPVIEGGFFIAHSSLPSISQDFLKDPDNWLVQIGDSDSI